MGLPCLAELAMEYRHEHQLADLQALFDRYGSVDVLGGASNVLLPARLLRPVVLMRSQGIKLVGQTSVDWLIDVAAGQNWHDWVGESLRLGCPGLENLALIPGTVGAAPVQNIGAYGVELDQRLHAVEIWDLSQRQRRWLSVSECQFGYRDSVFKKKEGRNWIVLTVRFALPRLWRPVLDYPDLSELRAKGVSSVTPTEVFEKVVAVRQAKLPDPLVRHNVGSFFKNPVVSAAKACELARSFPGIVTYDQADGRVKLAAAWMIDQCGFKGRRMGAVAVHERQALVLVNEGGATVQDVLALASAIEAAVRSRFGVTLEMEPGLWN